MNRARALVVPFVASLLARTSAAGQAAAPGRPATEPVFVRAQQMVVAGQDSAGRVVIDSVLAATSEGNPRYAEALFWRATLSKTAAAAERDYRRIAVDFPFSPRSADALIRLAQLEMTRGDRAGARAHLERLHREHPLGSTSTRGSVMLAQLAFNDGDIAAGCTAVAAARDGLTAADVELRNQVDYYGPRCANLAAMNAARDSAAASISGRGPDSAAASRGPVGRETAASRQEYSVQLAAYETRAAADSLARQLSTRGYAARVVGDRAPYRVRVGRYPTRERASDAVRQMARQNVRGIIVQAEPR